MEDGNEYPCFCHKAICSLNNYLPITLPSADTKYSQWKLSNTVRTVIVAINYYILWQGVSQWECPLCCGDITVNTPLCFLFNTLNSKTYTQSPDLHKCIRKSSGLVCFKQIPNYLIRSNEIKSCGIKHSCRIKKVCI